MDIISEEVWQIIEPYIGEDIGSSEDIEKTLQRLKEKYPQYYEEVRELLAGNETATNYFSQLGESIRKSVTEKTYPPGYHIGVYEITELVSDGGMSHVYRARRTDGEYDQQVAIKVLKESLHNEPLRDQFRREKQILADLNHPHIASIYDSGLTEEGRPYFIMEFIEGLPVTDYCDKHKLSIDDRLKLFIGICQAVNYAHQNLVIHKDLKPNNIFIDKNGFPKLMDFGIARIAEEAESNNDALNAYTPRYASPEQKTNDKVTTLSDVYQLGLLLCNLLTGIHWQDIQHKFKAPSLAAVFGTFSKNEATRVLTQRGLQNTKQLSRELKGDLHAALATSLHENPDERYRTVQELQTDIENYFNNQPLKARGLHFSYLLSKFVKRNRIRLKVASFFLLVITGLMINHTISITQQKNKAKENARKAEMQASKAQSITSYLKSVFSLGDPYLNSAKDISVNEMLEKGYNHLINASDIDAGFKAELLLTMSSVFLENGAFDKSRHALKKAHQIKASLKTDHHHDLSETYSQYATYWPNTNQLDTTLTLINEADAYLKQGKAEKAANLFQEVYKIEKNIYPEDHPNLAFTLTRLARSLMDSGKPGEAYPHIEKAYAIIDEKFDSIHSRRGDCATLMAEYYLKKQKWSPAKQFAMEGMTIFSSLHDKNHWRYEYTSALKILAERAETTPNRPKKLYDIFQSLNNRQYAQPYFINQLQELAGERGGELRFQASVK